MGDIFSSQWVNRQEYYRRIHRFKWISQQIDSNNKTVQGNHIYYFLAGNHDIGYGEETRKYHITRYLNNFGPLNRKWYVDFERASDEDADRPGLHKVAILNAMNLDATRNEEYRREAWDFIRDLATERISRPEIPFILFLHIPLNKPAGVCEPSPVTRLKDDFIAYQDYLSPATSAFLLHCLRPTVILNGHDHNGCLATHLVRNTTHLPVHLGDSGRYLQSSGDLCSMTLEELDMHSSEVEAFAESTVLTSGSSNITTADHLWSTIEITARSTMGAYGGVTGIFDIKRDHALDCDSTFYPRGRREMSASADGYKYQYREVALGHHIVIRVLLIVDIASAVIVPALLLLVK
ncbi:hypothetical protein LPJ53_004072 [Coemansia erecta]|uniref:Calcineurin-like phosphoesterase domain-containing protein n=1 Tax=Coemansia erecta TaxID=147472 RepID=A0A9W7Y0N8_9FUNG|nr:hypothetical protein LPJ53_004072 [Coemansia erecta]